MTRINLKEESNVFLSFMSSSKVPTGEVLLKTARFGTVFHFTFSTSGDADCCSGTTVILMLCNQQNDAWKMKKMGWE